MAVIDHIDGENRDIYLHSDTVGVEVHPVDIYKEMRTFRRADESLRKYDIFLTAKGNDEKGDGKYTERYVICMNGARIVPYNTSHTITITGTIITDDGQEGIACFDRSPLNTTTVVDINYVPPQVEIVTLPGSGLTLGERETLERLKYLNYQIYLDPENSTNGDGSQQHPFQSTTDAIDLAEFSGMKELVVYSEIVVARSLKNFTVRGVGTPKVELQGLPNMKRSEFFHCELTGGYTEAITAQQCLLSGLYLNGFFETCALAGVFIVPDGGNAYLTQCTPLVIGFDKPVFDIGGVIGTASALLMGWKGGCTVRNCNQPNDAFKIVLNGGAVDIESTCTNGIIVVIGTGRIGTDNSGADCTVITESLLNHSSISISNWNATIEGKYSAEQMLRLVAAALAGELSGADGNTITIRDIANSKDRIIATVDGVGNRTAVALDAV